MRRRYSFGIILIGRSSLLRDGLARVLRSASLRVLAEVPCADGLPISRIHPHQMLFLVVHTGDDFCATVEQVGSLKSRHPNGCIAVVADHYRPIELVSAFRAGATGYFVDAMSSDAFVKSIELVMMGETVFPRELLSFTLEPEANHLEEVILPDGSQVPLVTAEDGTAPRLSPREQSILRCLIKGDSNKSIARKTDIAEATVKVHVKAILRKIRVQNRTQAAIWGMNNEAMALIGNAASILLNPGQSEQVPVPKAELM
jgi:two-component system, NarL family, nitrate/nitrite response regulator NarL